MSESSVTYTSAAQNEAGAVPKNTAVATYNRTSDGAEIQEVLIGGVKDNNSASPVSLTPEGHLEVAIHAPTNPFGSVHVEELTPVFQTDAVYGLNTQQVVATTGLSFGTGANSGAVTGANNLFKCETGTTQYSFATLQSRRRLRYRPGQGIVSRFAGFFSTPAANSIIVGGAGTGESGYFFGYNGTQFGILHSTGGVREIQTLTVTTASTATNNYVVTLPDTSTVSITATNNSSTVKTAYEISQGVFPGWKATAIGSTVVFLANSVGDKSGVFTLAQTGAGSPAAGTCVQTLAGAATTDTWYYQTAWNGDRLDGSGGDNNPSGVTLDPTKGNVYQIGIQYLGFGAVAFAIEICPTNSNNPTFVTVHTIKFNNTRTAVTQSQPSFPFTMAAYSAGSTTNVSLSVGSFGGFIEGNRVSIGPRQTYFNNSGITSSTSAYTPIFTVKSNLVFNGRANQVVSRLLSLGGAAKSTTGLTTFFLIKDATLTGTPNFAAWSATSSTLVDTAATGCSFSDNGQVVFTAPIAESANFDINFADTEITMQPGESYTLAVRSVTATATCIGTLNIREDQ